MRGRLSLFPLVLLCICVLGVDDGLLGLGVFAFSEEIVHREGSFIDLVLWVIDIYKIYWLISLCLIF